MSIGRSITGTGQPGTVRALLDFYPTPEPVTRALLAVETFTGPVWEPASGEGHISRVLEDAGYPVFSSDLRVTGFGHGGFDFLKFTPQFDPGAIVTNPPFKLAEQFIARAKQFPSVAKLALLLKLTFLEGAKRQPMFQYTVFPLARVHVFINRVSFAANGETDGGAGMIAFAWFVWDRSHTGAPRIGWIKI